MDNFVAENQKKTIVLTGGGTGGHIYPNLAIVPSLKKMGLSVVYIGGIGDTLEKRLALKNNLPYHGVPTIKLVRSLSPKATLNNIKIPFTLSRAIASAVAILEKVQPSAIFSKGGFVSLPVVLAGLKLDIPVFCHESDQTLGLANKLGVKKGATLLKGNPHSNFDGIFVGMPLRAQLFSTSRSLARQKLNIDEKKNVLLIVGGSSGASVLNEAVTNNLDKLVKRFFVIHITGIGKSAKFLPLSQTKLTTTAQPSVCDQTNNISKLTTTTQPSVCDQTNNITKLTTTAQSSVCDMTNTKAKTSFSSDTMQTGQMCGGYLQLEYADNIEDYLHASDIVVSRAGATAVAELSALQKKALFIPLPKGISRGDQIFNAELAKEYGANVLLQDKSFSVNFVDAVIETASRPSMKVIETDANGKIARILYDSIRRGDLCKNKKQSPNG